MVRVAAIGRFQPFHWGHFEYLTEAARLGGALVVGVANPSANERKFTDADPDRSTDESNPFSFEQRRRIITAGLEHASIVRDLELRPCDLRSPEALRQSLGACDLVALTIYDGWGEEKRTLARSAGYKVVTLWERKEKITTGSEIRRRLREGAPWEHLVPPGAARVIGTEFTNR